MLKLNSSINSSGRTPFIGVVRPEWQPNILLRQPNAQAAQAQAAAPAPAAPAEPAPAAQAEATPTQ